VVFVETPTFTRRVLDLLDDEEYRLLFIYRKNEQDDLAPAQVKVLRRALAI
jgi:hypothetical protein